MSDLSSATSEDSRFSTSDVGLNTNLTKDKLARTSRVNQADVFTSSPRPDRPLCPLIVA